MASCNMVLLSRTLIHFFNLIFVADRRDTLPRTSAQPLSRPLTPTILSIFAATLSSTFTRNQTPSGRYRSTTWCRSTTTDRRWRPLSSSSRTSSWASAGSYEHGGGSCRPSPVSDSVRFGFPFQHAIRCSSSSLMS